MSIYREIRERRVLPAVGVYIGACWVVIEILDRLTDRYFLSPYLTDIVFWGLYSLLPAVILLAWTHGRPGKDRATRAEMIGIPLNLRDLGIEEDELRPLAEATAQKVRDLLAGHWKPDPRV